MIRVNKLDITNQVELARAEGRLSKLGAKQLFDTGDIEKVDIGTDYPPVFRTTWLSGYCYRLWPKACLFIIVRAFVAQIGMPSVAIVPSLDPSKDVLYC